MLYLVFTRVDFRFLPHLARTALCDALEKSGLPAEPPPVKNLTMNDISCKCITYWRSKLICLEKIFSTDFENIVTKIERPS